VRYFTFHILRLPSAGGCLHLIPFVHSELTLIASVSNSSKIRPEVSKMFNFYIFRSSSIGGPLSIVTFVHSGLIPIAQVSNLLLIKSFSKHFYSSYSFTIHCGWFPNYIISPSPAVSLLPLPSVLSSCNVFLGLANWRPHKLPSPNSSGLLTCPLQDKKY
jgi:hypothetical protein